MTDDQLYTTQVIEYLDDDTIRLYTITPDLSHIGDIHDPLTTITVKGYEVIKLDGNYGRI